MGRMSARFVGQMVGMSTEWVYGMWKDMGLVEKDKFGDWILTAIGKSVGGKMSKNSYRALRSRVLPATTPSLHPRRLRTNALPMACSQTTYAWRRRKAIGTV